VLEVGCGHGGGASYIARTMHPDSYVALDVNPAGVDYCRRKHDVPGLEFVWGDAEDLPFPAHSFDAVINVESSHLYPRLPRFLDEVARVLRGGGHFLYTDARPARDIAGWESALANAPIQMVSQKSISVEVVRGMEKTLHQWDDVIDRVTPAPLRRVVRGLAPARRAYADLRGGAAAEYRLYCFATT
jgi:ubiquinone/menaquinone biosynthesis C-methylase UbiE